jgi:hypothetical protein
LLKTTIYWCGELKTTKMAVVERMEARLNGFVRFIAFLERAGNALGTIAFIWATVVVLGGFSDNLGKDFWVATVIVFLEAFRYPLLSWKSLLTAHT